ncbi:MAG: ArgR family transcriptional regulator [Dysgonamonadaceae bacterium]|jgi:transcriptional regulator of arginine metabolism|nr:ArgR family transcriptional regulator [Dysgonamonadaceae bacterium]
MKTKEERLLKITELVRNNSINNQEELLVLLSNHGFEITQATLSRDIKQLKIIKCPDAGGSYIYTIPGEYGYQSKHPDIKKEMSELSDLGFLSLDFSGNLVVIRTRPGYAMGIASDIDKRSSGAILGTIAGDDTILLIPKEGYSRIQVIKTLKELNIK